MAARNVALDGYAVSRVISIVDEELYQQACNDDKLIAASVLDSVIRGPVTIILEGRGRQMISRIEEAALRDPIRTERGMNYRGIKPVLQVYFPGSIVVGQPYMVMIPFYIIGRVCVGDKMVEMNKYYHVFGNCVMTVDRDSKLGVWVYKLGY